MLRVRVTGPDGVEDGTVEDGALVTAGGRRIELLDAEAVALPDPYELLLPIEPPEVWCAGVTYERSRDARVEESAAKDVYALVYDAERPELFLKDAACRRTVGPGRPIGVRADSAWNVPEPEIALVLGEGGEIVGVTIGNDVSSRDIDGANPLYLPQAKVYTGSCVLGPCIVPAADVDGPFDIRLVIERDGAVVFEGTTSTAKMRRTFPELAAWLSRGLDLPSGAVLMTGTGLVPDEPFTLLAGDTVSITVDPIGTLTHTVELLECGGGA